MCVCFFSGFCIHCPSVVDKLAFVNRLLWQLEQILDCRCEGMAAVEKLR